ncbi:MAG: bifunctional sulfate adenylyltransferase subunit 1/adenylylsulfate kinase [Elusimicrobia bacterium RIFOXYB2_FULL_49_7]|nr:MAG: bifunctional sulfate adenylyltransferase subunit 1/adenylylsulfate kinase [Elusimicrobia bacterium RIFOXYB2_FULL_49_7]
MNAPIPSFLEEDAGKTLLRFSTAGSVDDGKSTLIGRLLLDSKNIYEDHIASVRKASTHSDDQESLDLFLFTDGLKAEREQGITIDVAYRYFSTPHRKFIIADTPGHEQYTRNMATGASTANLSIVLIDARKGVLPQSKRHAFIASLLRVPHLIVAVNKMDLVGYDEAVFNRIRKEFSDFAARLSVPDLRFIPISALQGGNVVEQSDKMAWYKGESLLTMLENVHVAGDSNFIDFRFPVQWVNRPTMDFRGYSGTIASGVVRKGDEVMVLPSMRTSRVKSIVTWDGEVNEAFVPMAVTILLEDEIDISRGDMLIHKHNQPQVSRSFEAMVVWMDEAALDPEKFYYLKQAGRTTKAQVEKVHYRVDVNTLHRLPGMPLQMNEIGRLRFSVHQPLFFDAYAKNRSTGNFVLIDALTNRTVAAGMMIDREPQDKMATDVASLAKLLRSRLRPEKGVTAAERAARLGQKGVTVWITGRPGSCKSEVAYALERKLFEAGALPFVLSGGDIRAGLSIDLDYSNLDRLEHLRRVAELAGLLNRSGVLTIGAFISPTQEMRNLVREIIGPDRYVEIALDAPLDWCKQNDKSGIYAKAEKGEVRNVPGVDFPFEVSTTAASVIKIAETGVEQAVATILSLLRQKGIFPCQKH